MLIDTRGLFQKAGLTNSEPNSELEDGKLRDDYKKPSMSKKSNTVEKKRELLPKSMLKFECSSLFI